MTDRLCEVEGCDRKHSARGYCNTHYSRLRRRGSTETRPPGHTPTHPYLRLVEHSESHGDCWVYLSGSVTSSGHRSFMVDGRMTFVHRWAYEFFLGPIPDGLVLDHLCRNPPCWNPSHLDPVTPRVNSYRAPSHPFNRTCCPRGHEYSGVNSHGRRVCRVCSNTHNRLRRARQRQAVRAS